MRHVDTIAATTLFLLWSDSIADMRIHFLDAGQADAALIQIDQPNGDLVSIVVDGGNHDSDIRDRMPQFMNGDTTIELAVLTHPHEDHIGGLDFLLNNFTVEHVWSNLESHTISAYDRYETAIDTNGVMETRPE